MNILSVRHYQQKQIENKQIIPSFVLADVTETQGR